MLTDKGRRRRATNQRMMTAGLVANGIVTLALTAADAVGLARIPLGLALGMFGLACFNFLVFSIVNLTSRNHDERFMWRFYWATMCAQLGVSAYGAIVADAIRPLSLAITVVTFGLLIRAARLTEAVAYCAIWAAIYLVSVWLGPWLLDQPPHVAQDLAALLMWLPVAGLMCYLVGQTHADRSTMAAQRRQIQALDEQKTRFFRNVSHEIRTPLTMILNPLAAELERDGDQPNVEVAHRNAQRLHGLVNQLLELQALEAKEAPLDLVDIDLAAFARTFGETWYPVGLPRGVQVVVRAPAPVHSRVQIDALETIAFNYVSNAVKYSPDHGRVTIEVRADHHRAELSVTDEGPGIPAEDLGRLFQEFSQVGAPSDRRQGTGLGLALVKRLAARLGAEVGVESTPGAGSRFWLRLPTRPPSGTAAIYARVGPVPAVADEPPEIPEPPIPALPDDGWILVAEDQRDLRRHVVALLGPFGVPVIGVPDGEAALELVRRSRPQLVVTDWMMPRRTGPELIEALRADPERSSVPVVLLTASADEESRLLGSSVGADVFVGKPFDRAELVSVVRNLLRLKDRERAVDGLNRRLREVVLQRFLPPSLVDDVVAGRAAFDDAPKTLAVTVLFADIVGFTPLTERLRASRIATFLREYLDAMSEVVFEHGGVVDKFLGDGVMALFGAPIHTPPEDQVQLAVACARAMHRRMATANAGWAASGIGEVRLRIGLHHGPAAVGWLGTQHRLEYTAVGPAVNQASRIEAVCEPGAVFVSAAIADWLPAADVVPLGLFELRGIPSPQPLFRLAGDRASTAVPPLRRVHLESGAVYDRYRILRRIGIGGLAAVYAVRHERLDTLHALKVLVVVSDELHQRLVLEGRLQARLDAPNVVPVTDVIDVHGAPALVMPLVEGCSLAELATRYRPTPEEAAALFAGILAGVAAAHAIGVVHRDLKPANVLLDPAKGAIVPRVSDFGIARVLDAVGPTDQGVFVGTLAYAAPEQLRDASRVGPGADVWALGVLLHELWTGRRPDGGPSDALPSPWRTRIARMTDPDPDQRPSTAELLAEIGPAPSIPGDGPLAAAIVGQSPPTDVDAHLSPARLVMPEALTPPERSHLERCARCRVDRERMLSGV